MTLLGLVGMMDPPRAEAEAAVRDLRDAGIHAMMITGDHPLTASAVAEGDRRAARAARRVGRGISTR